MRVDECVLRLLPREAVGLKEDTPRLSCTVFPFSNFIISKEVPYAKSFCWSEQLLSADTNQAGRHVHCAERRAGLFVPLEQTKTNLSRKQRSGCVLKEVFKDYTDIPGSCYCKDSTSRKSGKSMFLMFGSP